MSMPTVNFLSYNSTGISAIKCDFINKFNDKYEVTYTSIQEHFKKTKTTDKYFCSHFPKYNSYVIPAFRAKEQDSGRPKGGLTQLSCKSVDVKKDRVSTKNYRIQAQILNFPTARIMWINSYLPTDPLTVDFDDAELLEVLGEIESILSTAKFDDVVWNGDLNFDPSRNSGFCRVMKSFLEKVGLVSLWETYAVTHTHVHTD